MTEARIILRICDRFGCTPREAERQDAGVLRLLEIEGLKGWRMEVSEQWQPPT